jgi:HNH endonuclease
MSRLAERHHGKPCGYCQRPMDQNSDLLSATRDHTVPRCRGGHKSAKVICCRKCNGLKADMLPAEWDAYMLANPKWWLLSKGERRARRINGKLNGKVWPTRRELQGSPPPGPVVVPPELIWKANQMRPYERSQFLLKAYRDAKVLEVSIPQDDPAD